MQVLASQLHFLANRNAELAVLPLFWSVNCIKIGGHVAPLSCPSIYFLFFGGLFKWHGPVKATPGVESMSYMHIMLLPSGHHEEVLKFDHQKL